MHSISQLGDHTTLRMSPDGFSRRDALKRGAFILAVVGAAPILSACGPDDDSDSGSEDERTLAIRTVLDIQSLDPAFMSASVGDAVMMCVAENLVTYPANGSDLVNELAEELTSSEDGLSHTFKLKQGMQFQKGYGEVTAEDVKFSFERIAPATKPDIDSTYSGDWATLKEVEVTGKYSGVIRLSEAFAPLFLTTLPGNAGIIISKKAYEELGDSFATNPVGSGPYEFTSWERGQEILLTRFDKWAFPSEKWASKPKWKEIKFNPIADPNSANIAIETQEVDVGQVSYSSVDRFKNSDEFDVATQTTLDYGFVGFNVTDPKLSDIRVRRAIRLALDVDSMINAAFEGNTTRAHALIAPDMPIGYWKDAPQYEQDLEAAKDLLSQAGVGDLALEMGIREGPGSGSIAEIVQANLANIGIKVSIKLYPGAQLHDQVKSLQMFYQSFSNQADPSWATVWFTSEQVGNWNMMSWSNKEFDQLHQDALIEQDQSRRDEIYVQMQQIMEEEALASWVMYRTRHYAHPPELKPALVTQRFGKYRAWSFGS